MKRCDNCGQEFDRLVAYIGGRDVLELCSHCMRYGMGAPRRRGAFRQGEVIELKWGKFKGQRSQWLICECECKTCRRGKTVAVNEIAPDRRLRHMDVSKIVRAHA